MTLFESILVPLDGSEHSLRALDVAVQIAKVFKAKLMLIHVYSATVRPIILPEPTTLTPSGVPAITAEEVTKVIEAARGAGERILADGKQRAEACQLKAKTLLKEGQTTQEIIRTAKRGAVRPDCYRRERSQQVKGDTPGQRERRSHKKRALPCSRGQIRQTQKPPGPLL